MVKQTHCLPGQLADSQSMHVFLNSPVSIPGNGTLKCRTIKQKRHEIKRTQDNAEMRGCMWSHFGEQAHQLGITVTP